MAGSPNFPSDNASFYFYENTPTNFADSDPDPVTESPNMGPSSSRPQTSTRKRTSRVWQFYDIVKILNKRTHAVCEKCKKDFSCQTSERTSHLKRHADKHTTSQNDHARTQISFSNSNIRTFVFNNENARKEITKFIVQIEQPFYLAENPRL